MGLYIKAFTIKSASAKSVNSSRNWYARMLFVPTWNWHIPQMSKNRKRESEALEWAEAPFKERMYV